MVVLVCDAVYEFGCAEGCAFQIGTGLRLFRVDGDVIQACCTAVGTGGNGYRIRGLQVCDGKSAAGYLHLFIVALFADVQRS